MKKLDIKLGGHHLVGDDLLFMQSALLEGLAQLLEAFGGAVFVVSGFELTNIAGTLTWTAGWVYMGGELLQIDAGSSTYATDNTLVVVETNDAEGDQEYEDGNIEHTYLIRKATVQGLAGQSLAAIKYLKKWKDVNNNIHAGAWTASGNSFYGLDLAGNIILQGAVTVAAFATPSDDTITTLPAGYRPVWATTVIVPAIVNGTKTFKHLYIDPSGAVQPLGLSATEAVTIYFDGIRISR